MSKKLYLELDEGTKRMAAAAAAIRGVPMYTYIAGLITADCKGNGLSEFLQEKNTQTKTIKEDSHE